MVNQEPGTEKRNQDFRRVPAQTDSSRKRSRAFAITSLSLGLLSVPLAVLSIWILSFPPALVLIGNPFAILGIIFGILQLRKRRSARVLAYSGILCSVLALGVSSLVDYRGFVAPPTYVDELTRMGYDRTVIDNPIPVELFRAVDQPSAQWIFSGVYGGLGWYHDDQQGEIPIEMPPITSREPTEPVSFDPGNEMFGFFIWVPGVYEWYTESTRNDDGKSHVKIYPMIIKGRKIPNSYLLCWEDYPLNLGSSAYVDFTDFIVRVDGVQPAR